MKCEGCGADLSHASDVHLRLFHSQIEIQCPLCKCNMIIIYNRRRQIWETEKERDRRRAKWTYLPIVEKLGDFLGEL